MFATPGIAAGIALLLLSPGFATAAWAAGTDTGGYGDSYVFYNGWDVDIAFEVDAGNKPDKAYSGDWDHTGVDSLATRNGIEMALYGDKAGNPAVSNFRYWWPQDEVFSGDWDGDGVTTFGVRRAGTSDVEDGQPQDTFYLRNSFGDGEPDYKFDFGTARDLILVGDFTGTGKDGIALRNGNHFAIMDDVSQQVAREVTFGPDSAVNVVAVGDWDGDGTDTPLVRSGNTYYAYNSWNYSDGPAEEVTIGGEKNAVLVGDWDGDGRDTLALRNFNFKLSSSGQTTKSQTTALVDNPKFRLRADAAASLERVEELWGQALTVNDGWRPFETQRSIFLSRYTPGRKGGGDFCDVRNWNGTRYIRTSELGPAAVPGTSNHGSGTAVDIGGFESFGDPVRLRFLALARDFGWSDAEGCQVGERWHLTYNPANDKGNTSWSPTDPIDKSASHCPDKVIGPSTYVPPSKCRFN